MTAVRKIRNLGTWCSAAYSMRFHLLLALWMAFSQVASANGATGPTQSTGDPVKKFALVIGNGTYLGFKGSLKNPANDARLMAQSLLKLGFEVKQYSDLNRAELASAVSNFADALPPGATALVYYAGHGMQVGGHSYLIPVDMQVTSEQSVPLRAYAVKTLLEKISSAASAVNVLVFDACRDNPFQPAPPVRYRSFANLGLAPIQAPRGTVVAYSTAPGQLAADGIEGNSAYTAALAKVILEQGLALEDIFKKVGNDVRRKTFDDQIPWFESSLTEEYFFLPPPGVTVVAGRPLKRESADVTPRTAPRGVDVAHRATDVLWYRSMSDLEWATLDRTLQQRVDSAKSDAIALLQHQANGGSVVAQTTLGRLLRDGMRDSAAPDAGVRTNVDLQASIDWFQKASDAGFPIAQLELGDMYRRGIGVSPDRKLARQWIALAAKANYPRAQLLLLKLGIEDQLVNPQDVNERLVELEHKVRTTGDPGLATPVDDTDQKEQKQMRVATMRKELALRGLKWSNADFGEALLNGDLDTVQMYLDAGWNPLSLYEEGNALAHFIWRAGRLDAVVIEAMLKLFVEHGVDPNAAVLKFRGLAPNTMALHAVRACNSVALAESIRLGAIVGNITASIKQYGAVYPPDDGGVDCTSQIAKIGAALNMRFRCAPKSWDRTQNACELF